MEEPTVVIVRAGADTVSENDFEPVRPALSVTWTVKVNVPAVCGVPEIIPVGSRLRPSVFPERITQLYGAVPLLAASVVEV